MKAVCGWDAARVRKAQEDAEAKRILDNNRSWSVTMAGTERYSSGWDAVRWMLEQSGRTGLLRWLPDGPRGREWYVWIGKRREKFSHAGRIVFGRRRWKTPGVTGEAVSTLAIGSVIAWNIASFPATREHVGDYQKYVNPWVATFNLRQYWTMFAPAPYLNDWWMVGIGLDREGQILQLFTGEELPDALKPPANGSRYYRIHRWRKLLNYAYRNGEMEHVLAYWCRTGRWQAMSVWMVWRRNLGTHETSRQPYQREKAWQWVCEEVNQEQLEKFEGEVSYRDGRRDPDRGAGVPANRSSGGNGGTPLEIADLAQKGAVIQRQEAAVAIDWNWGIEDQGIYRVAGNRLITSLGTVKCVGPILRIDTPSQKGIVMVDPNVVPPTRDEIRRNTRIVEEQLLGWMSVRCRVSRETDRERTNHAEERAGDRPIDVVGLRWMGCIPKPSMGVRRQREGRQHGILKSQSGHVPCASQSE